MLQILCLHGYQESGTILYKKLENLQKALQGVAKLHCLDGPVVVDKQTDYYDSRLSSSASTEPSRAWYRVANDKALGFDNFFKSMDQLIQTKGPFDGILGYSQGAAAAALYLKYLQVNDRLKMTFKFSILCGCYPIFCDEMSFDIEPIKIDIPNLHFFGKKDTFILPEISQMMLDYFEEGIELRHEGKHYLPTREPYLKDVVTFVAKFQRKKL